MDDFQLRPRLIKVESTVADYGEIWTRIAHKSRVFVMFSVLYVSLNINLKVYHVNVKRVQWVNLLRFYIKVKTWKHGI